MVSLLDDAGLLAETLSSNANLCELRDTCAKLEVRLSRIMGKEKEIHPTLVPAVNLMSQPGHSSNVFGQASRALARPEKWTLLPPSPECKQRRKTSYAERNVSEKNRTKSMRYMIVNHIAKVLVIAALYFHADHDTDGITE
ncbi:hypothetical protein JB92DRAFT_2832875 [Gautieria morchelliformis]|nr:hypothetical protein JB92DRAFT_2832875 [Gautieria morchelliformis]